MSPDGPTVRRAFVVGATGYTGREVVPRCVARGAETVAHVRADSGALDEWRARFTLLGATVDATPWSPDAMRETLRALRPTHVFALLGTTRARARRAGAEAARETYEAVDYGLTHLLLRALLAAGVRARVVYLSAAGASEASRSAYLRVRGRLEREIRESGLPYLIARPTFISGPDRGEWRPLERAAATASDRVLGVLGAFGAHGLRDRYRSITGAELAEALVRFAFEDDAARREVGRAELGRQLAHTLPRRPV